MDKPIGLAAVCREMFPDRSVKPSDLKALIRSGKLVPVEVTEYGFVFVTKSAVETALKPVAAKVAHIPVKKGR